MKGQPVHRYAPGHVRQTLPGFPDLVHVHRAHPKRYPHLLESVARGPEQARHDILFAFPGSELTLSPNGRLYYRGRPSRAPGFLSAFERLWLDEAITAPPGFEAPPFTGGWFVFLGYEAMSEIEPVLTGLPREPALPVAQAVRFPAAIIRDHADRIAYLVCEQECAAELLPRMAADVAGASENGIGAAAGVGTLTEEPERLFLERVRRIQEYIRAGDVFQVNLSRLWRAELATPVPAETLYRCLRAANPAPFAGLMTLDGNRAVISSSPERLVSVTGRTIRTRPIAGTYPRSADPALDRAWSRDLICHPKERAEHVMLIDLERNDLGRLCRPGTVEVSELMVLESYRHVHHIVSEIRGELRATVNPADVIRAVFPGGTVTGCPKVRSMQIIAELEQAPRGAYTGSMGYVNRDGNLDFNILIRTVIQRERDLQIRAGAGIVIDSSPQRELEETRAKARGMLAALEAA